MATVLFSETLLRSVIANMSEHRKEKKRKEKEIFKEIKYHVLTSQNSI
jgi:hypothetical protein